MTWKAFTVYSSIYVELADQYKVMDAVSDVRRRNMLARHLQEVVDILEQKVQFPLFILFVLNIGREIKLLHYMMC